MSVCIITRSEILFSFYLFLFSMPSILLPLYLLYLTHNTSCRIHSDSLLLFYYSSPCFLFDFLLPMNEVTAVEWMVPCDVCFNDSSAILYLHKILLPVFFFFFRFRIKFQVTRYISLYPIARNRESLKQEWEIKKGEVVHLHSLGWKREGRMR